MTHTAESKPNLGSNTSEVAPLSIHQKNKLQIKLFHSFLKNYGMTIQAQADNIGTTRPRLSAGFSEKGVVEFTLREMTGMQQLIEDMRRDLVNINFDLNLAIEE